MCSFCSLTLRLCRNARTLDRPEYIVAEIRGVTLNECPRLSRDTKLYLTPNGQELIRERACSWRKKYRY